MKMIQHIPEYALSYFDFEEGKRKLTFFGMFCQAYNLSVTAKYRNIDDSYYLDDSASIYQGDSHRKTRI